MPDDGAVSAGKATVAAAATDEDGFDFAPLMAEGERLIWQGRSRPLWRELLHGNLKMVFLFHFLVISIWNGTGIVLLVNFLQEDLNAIMFAVFLLGTGAHLVWQYPGIIRMRDRLRYAVTSRQLLVGVAGRKDLFAQLPLYMVKKLALLEQADGSGSILFHRDENDPCRKWSQTRTEIQVGFMDVEQLKDSIPRFALIDDVRAVHDLIERERLRVQEYWKRAEGME